MRRLPPRLPLACVLTLASVAAACAGAPAPGPKPAAAPVSQPAAPAVSRADDPPALAGSFAPRIEVLGERVVLSWVEPDPPGGGSLRYAAREGAGWSAPRTAAGSPALASDASDVPGVVPLHGGSLAAYWTVKREGAPYARDVVAAVSRDGGATWSAPSSPHRDGTPSPRGMPTVVPRPAGGGFGIAWLDGRSSEQSAYGEGGTALYWADWTGSAFGQEIVLDPRVCDCCKTAGALTPAGPVVAYRDRRDGERRDISIVREDGGSWSPPASLSDDGWSLVACPTNGPAIAQRGDRGAVAWFTGANAAPAVWAALSGDGAKTFGAALRVDGGTPSGRVDVAVLVDGSAVVVWLEKHGDRGEVRARRLPAGGGAAPAVVVAQTSAARSSGYPRVAAAGDREALVAWTETGPPSRVRAAVVTLP